jgi:hypothetical protein
VTRHLLVIGGQRCGTTYLHSVLDAHPDITMARPSRPEPKVFLRPDDAARGLDWYRATYFAHAAGEQLLGEKTSMLGAAEIIVLLRDPVARAVSNWQFSTRNGLESRPLVEALGDNLAGAQEWDTTVTATSVSPFAYLERGRYDHYLDAWYAAFPDTVHARFYDELVGEAAGVAELYGALGVDPDFRPAGIAERVNESEDVAPPLPADLVTQLREYFADSDAALRRRLGRELPWPSAG